MKNKIDALLQDNYRTTICIQTIREILELAEDCDSDAAYRMDEIVTKIEEFTTKMEKLCKK